MITVSDLLPESRIAISRTKGAQNNINLYRTATRAATLNPVSLAGAKRERGRARIRRGRACRAARLSIRRAAAAAGRYAGDRQRRTGGPAGLWRQRPPRDLRAFADQST